MKNCLGIYRFGRVYAGILLLLCLVWSGTASGASAKSHMPALIPSPQKIAWNGKNFKVGKNSSWLVQRITKNIPEVAANKEEGYVLKINADSAVLIASTHTGLYHGLQTVRQLTFEENGEQFVAGCTIADWPAFKIRGFMQDAGRNYMPLPMLKEQIEVMAAYKYNFFHFHLTDNPAWRLGSKRYPQLNSAASMSRWPGKYYTREDFLEIIQFCSDRFITVIPEMDVPGHCAAFRKAFAIDSMSDPRVKPILLDLVDELCSLVPAEKMPYLHLGTDEVWHKSEQAEPGVLSALMERARAHGREVIVWRPGQKVDNDQTSITQLWSAAGSRKVGHPYIDSRLNYLNHLDPLAGVAQLFFDRICGQAQGDSLALGGILCCWNDNNVSQPGDILEQNPVYPGLVTYSESCWKGRQSDPGQNFLAKLPPPGSPFFQEFSEFEARLVQHRDLYFRTMPFPYVRQTEIEWSLTGPFDNKGNARMVFPADSILNKNYQSDNKEFKWTGPFYGGTIHLHHFFNYPSYIPMTRGTVFAATNIWSPENQEVGCWIGFHDWSRSGGRRGGPFPVRGEWHITAPKVWLNGKEIAPPVWKNPGLPAASDEIPFSDENYFFRQPSKIVLKKGWNQVILKIPQDGKSWKWMYTFVPVQLREGRISEVPGLKYSTSPQIGTETFKMAPVFGEHMVLQQGHPIRLFGTAGIGDRIKVAFSNQEAECITGFSGKWSISLNGIPAGGPYSLKVFVNGESLINWNDILVGEVWFCSGQSNMQFRLDQSFRGAEEAVRATDGSLRLMNYRGMVSTSDEPWDTSAMKNINRFNYFSGSWNKCNPSEAAGFSAIAWYFGKVLREKLRVPVGLIQVTVGGAPAESFIDRKTIAEVPQLANVLPDWYNNELVMDWCRQRALKNIASKDIFSQKHPFFPGYIFEAGISKFKDFPVRGIIFYQGESNAQNPGHYGIVFPELINSWRENWCDEKMPFLYAQLSSIQRPGWEIFRDIQRRIAATIPNSGMVVTSDQGDSLNVHPVHKKEIGRRFALQALHKVYGKDVVADGPLPGVAGWKGDFLEISFSGGNLTTSDSGPVRELEIAGDDKVFQQATGIIEGNKIVIQNKNLNIKRIRYGWNPFSHGNLANEEGLPASTFLISINK